MGPLLRTLAVASCMVLAGTAPNRETTTPLYYMPLFETETEVYPEVLHYGDENTVVQIVEGYELHLHHTAIFPPRVLVRTFKDGEPIDRVMRTTGIRKEIFCDDSNGATLMIRRNRESNQTTVVSKSLPRSLERVLVAICEATARPSPCGPVKKELAA
ncbi:unnamed protein product, partial [Ixodes pacificus]